MQSRLSLHGCSLGWVYMDTEVESPWIQSRLSLHGYSLGCVYMDAV